MKVLVMFEISDETVEDIMKSDHHASDLIDQINQTAIYQDEVLELWHFDDAADPTQAISEIWTRWNTSVKPPTQPLIDKMSQEERNGTEI